MGETLSGSAHVLLVGASLNDVGGRKEFDGVSEYLTMHSVELRLGKHELRSIEVVVLWNGLAA